MDVARDRNASEVTALRPEESRIVAKTPVSILSKSLSRGSTKARARARNQNDSYNALAATMRDTVAQIFGVPELTVLQLPVSEDVQRNAQVLA